MEQPRKRATAALAGETYKEARERREAKVAEHTPGPWGITASTSGGERMVAIGADSEAGGLIAIMARDWFPEAVNRANARLIAAAPDLLSVAKDLLDIVKDEYEHDPEPDDLGSWRDAIAAAEAAIAKAEGRAI